MKTSAKILAYFGILLGMVGATVPMLGQSSASKIDVTQLKSVPSGNYLVTLEIDGQIKRLNFKIEGTKAKCVNSSDPKLKDLEGQFQLHGDGAFVGRFQGATFRGSQLWIFRTDGTAAVREVPDRGEQQSAVPVASDSIEPPKKKP